MTAREIQDSLPRGVAAAPLAERAGIKRATWAQMVWRGQALSSEQAARIAGALGDTSAECAALAVRLRG